MNALNWKYLPISFDKISKEFYERINLNKFELPVLITIALTWVVLVAWTWSTCVPQKSVLFLLWMGENKELESSVRDTLEMGILSPVSILSSIVELPLIKTASHSIVNESLWVGKIITSPGTNSLEVLFTCIPSRITTISDSEWTFLRKAIAC